MVKEKGGKSSQNRERQRKTGEQLTYSGGEE